MNLDDFKRIGPAVGVDSAGERVDAYLAQNFPFFSRAAWKKRVNSGMILVGRRQVRASYRVREGEDVLMYHSPQVEPEVDRNVAKIWQHEGVMAVFKPGNLPMHENGPYRKNTFTHLVWEKFGPEWAAVHRLDRETSGIVLCGNTLEIRQSLAGALAKRNVRKEYLAIAFGVPRRQSWVETRPIGAPVASRIRIKKWVAEKDPEALSAETVFHTIETGIGFSLMHVLPRTGRTNQIRIHAAAVGHHLVGDKLYFPDEEVFLEFYERGNTQNVQSAVGFHRLCLHAYRLTFTHPRSRETCTVTSPLPPDMLQYWHNKRGCGIPGSADGLQFEDIVSESLSWWGAGVPDRAFYPGLANE